MKTTVIRLCGHTEEVEVFGTSSERANKIAWYESTDCKTCYTTEQNKDCEEVTMSYADYRNNHANCKTKDGSYNKADKTIVVYVPAAKVETVEMVEKTTTADTIIAELIEELRANPTAKTLEKYHIKLIDNDIHVNAQKYNEMIKEYITQNNIKL